MGAILIPRVATAEPDAIEVPQVGATPVAPAISEPVGTPPHYERFLVSVDGLGGFFVAPGVEGARFVTRGVACPTTYPHDDSHPVTVCGTPQRQEWAYVGPSFDIGGQGTLPFGLTIGGSIGAHYRLVAAGKLDDSDMPVGWVISHGSGLRPRLRFWLGWAF